MLSKLIDRAIARAERAQGISLEYLRHIAHVSLPSFLRFNLFLPLANNRRALPKDAFHIARIVATRAEDCGTCVQITVNMALADGVAAGLIRSVLERRVSALPEVLRAVYEFAEHVSAADGAEANLRQQLRASYGEQGLVELALAIATARVFPTTKRALGYATSCALVQVDVPA